MNNILLNKLPQMQLNRKGFYRWAWPIITGCTNGCEYCYARKEIKNFETLRFKEEFIREPYKVPPSRIFVNYLGDVMLYPEEVINKILQVCYDLPEHTFIWMTKKPDKYWDYIFPVNCILGVSIESPDRWDRAEVMKDLWDRKMCSVEPILGDFTGYNFSQFEFVVVGCLIGTEDHSNYDTVKHEKIYYTR
jgi:protein gp37